MASNVLKNVNVKRTTVTHVMLLPGVVNVRQDGPVIPVHRTWTSVRRESERVIQVYIRSVSTTRVHLTVNVIMVGRILQTVTYVTRGFMEKTVRHSVDVGEVPRSVTTSRGVSVTPAGGERRVMTTSTSVTAVRVQGTTRSASTHQGPSGVPGFKNSSGTCEVCSPFTYGTECSEDCKCEKTKSEKCDAVTGNCHCQTGWTGYTCSQDVDECKEGTRTCNTSLHQVCVNNPGSSNCQCLYGGNNLTSCIRPKPTIHINTSQVKVKAEVRFDINASREDFVKHSEEWRKQIEETLMKFHRDTVPGFSTLVVLSIRLGSLWADYEIIGTKTQLNKNKFEAGVASSMSKILKGEHTFNILKQETRIIGVTMKDNNGSTTMTFTTPTSPCYLLKAFYECPSGYHCDDSLNKAECVLNDFSDLAIITISVGVGVPVLIAAIVIIILWKRYQRKARKLKEKSGHDETIPVTLAGKIPRPKHSPSSEYDFIDSRSLYDGRYTDLGCINPNYSEDSHRERRYQVDDQFPIKRPNVGPDMTREY